MKRSKHQDLRQERLIDFFFFFLQMQWFSWSRLPLSLELLELWRKKIKHQLPVFFLHWFHRCFAPLKYLVTKGLPFKVLLIFDNALASQKTQHWRHWRDLLAPKYNVSNSGSLDQGLMLYMKIFRKIKAKYNPDIKLHWVGLSLLPSLQSAPTASTLLPLSQQNQPLLLPLLLRLLLEDEDDDQDEGRWGRWGDQDEEDVWRGWGWWSSSR